MNSIDEEAEATYFAMHLLMPEHMLRAEIAKRKVFDLANEKHIAELARVFQVSPAIMGYRIGMLAGN